MALGAIRTFQQSRARGARRCLGRRFRRDRPGRLRHAVADDRRPAALRGRANRASGCCWSGSRTATAGHPARSSWRPRWSSASRPHRPRPTAPRRKRGRNGDLHHPRRTARRLPAGLRPLADERRRQQLQRPDLGRFGAAHADRQRQAHPPADEPGPPPPRPARRDVLEGDGELSSSWPTHQGLYRAFPEIGAVIHAHPFYATVFAAKRRDLPVLLDGMAKYGTIPRALRPATRSTARRSSRRWSRSSRHTAKRSRKAGSACSTRVMACSSPGQRSTMPTTCWSGWSSTPPRSCFGRLLDEPPVRTPGPEASPT